HPRSSTLGPRRKAFPNTRFVNFCLFDEQTVNVDTLGILGIGNRRAHRFRDDTRGPFEYEFENVQRLLDAFPTDLIYDQAHLPRGDSNKFCDRACFHISLLTAKRIPSALGLRRRRCRGSRWSNRRGRRGLFRLRFAIAGVRVESTRRRKFAKFMTNHIFTDKNWDKFSAV